jgi:hypothetical protein
MTEATTNNEYRGYILFLLLNRNCQINTLKAAGKEKNGNMKNRSLETEGIEVEATSVMFVVKWEIPCLYYSKMCENRELDIRSYLRKEKELSLKKKLLRKS